MAQVAPISSMSLHAKTSEELLEETDNVTAIELQRNRRVLYFSDGTMEESSDSDDNDITDKALDLHINEHDLPLLLRFKHKAARMAAGLLAGIDYVGGGLASFFGITSPEYVREMQIHAQQRQLEIDDTTWLSAGTSSAEIIDNNGRRDINKNSIRQ